MELHGSVHFGMVTLGVAKGGRLEGLLTGS